MFEALLKTAAGISTMGSLAAFAIAAIIGLATFKRSARGRGKNGKGPLTDVRGSVSGRVAAAAIGVLGLVPILAKLYADSYQPSVYEVRTVVLDPQQTPVEDAKVWSSFGGEAKKVSGGWQFDIPAASVPADHKLTVYGTVDAAFLKGQSEVTLGSDFHPNATIRLARAETSIRGIVTDDKGRAVEGAAVSVVGYGKEMVKTPADGGFELAAHGADGQQVELHAEKPGLQPGGGWFPAGSAPAEVELKRLGQK